MRLLRDLARDRCLARLDPGVRRVALFRRWAPPVVWPSSTRRLLTGVAPELLQRVQGCMSRLGEGGDGLRFAWFVPAAHPSEVPAGTNPQDDTASGKSMTSESSPAQVGDSLVQRVPVRLHLPGQRLSGDAPSNKMQKLIPLSESRLSTPAVQVWVVSPSGPLAAGAVLDVYSADRRGITFREICTPRRCTV